MTLTISIITPSFNQAEYIPTTIDSVLSQDYPHLEYIIIDGGSTDGTLDILDFRFPILDCSKSKIQNPKSKIHWFSEPDNGQAEAINKGFKKSTGEIVAWLNSDDIYMPQALHRVADFFSHHPHVDVVYGDYHLIDEKDDIILSKQEIPFDYHILLYGLDYISQPTVFLRRSLFDRVGYLDESLHYGLDWEYWLRISKHGGSFAHIPHYLAATRWHVEAKTLIAPPKMYAEHQAIRDRYWSKHKFQSSQLHHLYASWLNKFYRLKRQFVKIVLRRKIDFPPGHWVIRTVSH
jgi:glycosyltransferase involved in cell wall biosynthesis